MAFVELDDEILRKLEGVPFKDRSKDMKDMSDFMASYNKILTGPQRLELLKVIKKAYPDQVIPELDAAVPVNEEIEKIRKEFAEYKESQEKEKKEQAESDRTSKAKETVSKGRKWLREQGCDDEGVEAVEKIMQEEGLANYQRAFTLFSAEQPKHDTLPPGVYPSTNLDWFKPNEGDVDHKLLVDDPVKYKDAQVHKFFQQRAAGTLNLDQ